MNGNPFYVKPMGGYLDGPSAFAGLGKMFGQSMKAKQDEAKLNAQKEIYGSYMDAVDSGDFEAQREIERANPVLMDQLGKISSRRKSHIGGIEGDMANDYLLGGMSGEQLADKWEPQLQSLGQGRISERFRTASPAMLKGMAIQNMDAQSYQRYRDSLGGGKGDLPAEAVAFNNLIKDMSPEQQKTAKLVKAGLKGRAISNAELSAIESGEIKDYSDYKIKQKQAEKFAELSGSARAKAIDSGIERIAKIDLGLSNIDAAIEAVNAGAGTGVIEKKFPSLRAASVALDNIQGRMALDVIGAVTFGALSQGELDLAREVALPTGLEGPELIRHLSDRKAAQQKLRDYYNEQIQFLDQGGTVAGFLREKERQQGGGNADGAQQPSRPSDEDLLNKYL